MKDVRVKFVAFGQEYDYTKLMFYKILSKHYNIIECDDPDYVICSMLGKPFEHMHYPQIRIMISGENYIPDMNHIDYAVSVYPITLYDRYFTYPGCFDSTNHFAELAKKNRNYPDSFLAEKEFFASFITGVQSENDREGFFKKLCEYKRVESPGKYLNNMPDGMIVSWQNDSKVNFQRKCKFSLCFESNNQEGFITEKISDAFFSDSIPVYYGSSVAKEIFNPEAYIDVSDYESFDKAIERIIEIDNNDELYMHMMRQPILKDPNYYENVVNAYEAFVLNIFEQPIEQAFRRARGFTPKHIEDEIKTLVSPEELSTCKNVSIRMLINAAIRRAVNKLLKT